MTNTFIKCPNLQSGYQVFRGGVSRCKRAKLCVTSAANPEQHRRLKQAASEYAEAVSKGIDEDDVVAMQLGATDASGLTDTQLVYVDKLKAKLAQQAEEAKRKQEQSNIQFGKGKNAYSTGQYAASEVLFHEALQLEGDLSPLGGEIQLWLALAFQACGKEKECIELYKSIERNHPLPRVKRQAAELRYIMEAPKLKIGPDERVTLPLLEDQSRYVRQRGNNTRAAPRPPAMSKGSRKPKSFEEEFWESYKPPIPDIVKNRYFLVASAVLATGLAWYSASLSRAM